MDNDNTNVKPEMKFSEQIVYGMFSPTKYKNLLGLKTKRFILYIVVMMLVLVAATFIVPMAAFVSGLGGFETLFSKRMPQMTFTNQELKSEKPFELSYNSSNLLIDTSVETITDDMLDKDGAYFAVGSKTIRLVISLGTTKETYTTIPLNQFISEGFSNQTLVDNIPVLYTYLILVGLFTGAGLFIKYALYSLIFAICINSMNKKMELNLTFGKVFMICFYGQSLAMVLTNFNQALGILPSMIMTMITIFISIHMMTRAILHMKMSRES